MKKKFLSFALLAVALASVTMITPFRAADEIGVTIEGVNVIFTDQPPVIVDGRTLVPVRGVFEMLGFNVDWDNDTRQATLTNSDYIVVLTVGSATFTTNGVNHTLDVPAQIIGGRTMLPIRAVLESVAYYVAWQDGRVIVSANPIETAPEETAPMSGGDDIDIAVQQLSPYEMFAEVFRRYENANTPAQYAFHDLNSDGIYELFVSDGMDLLHSIERVYTFVGGRVHEAGSTYDLGFITRIDEYGTMLSAGSNELGQFNRTLRLSDDNTRIVIVAESLIDWSHGYTFTVHDETRNISEQEWVARYGHEAWSVRTDVRPNFVWLQIQTSSPYDMFANVLRRYVNSPMSHRIRYAFYDINSDGIEEVFICF
jgi:hypothetical protein